MQTNDRMSRAATARLNDARVVALIPDPRDRERIREALRPVASVAFCAKRDELLPLVRNQAAAAAVIEPRDANDEELAPAVRLLKRGYPSVAVLVYCRVAPSDSRSLLPLTRAGVDEVILRGFDDSAMALRSALVAALGTSTLAHAVEELRRIVPDDMMPTVEYCLGRASHAPTVEEVAAALGVHRKTLASRAAGAGLPSPRALIAWGRLLVAARMLEDPRRSVEDVARALEFSAAAELRNMFRRYTELRPLQVRTEGGMELVLDMLKAAIVRHPELSQSA
jgi:AraC-like DNA-binding protein